VLHRFTVGPRDGSRPLGNLVFDKAGNLYGTTYWGGANGSGTVFRLTPSSSGTWTETILYSFGAFVGDAALPGGGLFFDGHGNIFGVTESGGNGPCSVGGFSGCGAFFELTHSSGKWTEAVLYNFGGSPDAALPSGNLVADSQGNFYGPSIWGGRTNCADGCGTVYELSPSAGGSWTEQVIYAASDGFYPMGPLLLDQAGNLYGTATASNVFELSPSSSGWTEKVIYNFSGAPDGNEPESGLVRDQFGNLYGTTYWGGGGRCLAGQGCGTVFVLERSNGGFQEHSLALNGPQLPSLASSSILLATRAVPRPAAERLDLVRSSKSHDDSGISELRRRRRSNSNCTSGPTRTHPPDHGQWPPAVPFCRRLISRVVNLN